MNGVSKALYRQLAVVLLRIPDFNKALIFLQVLSQF
jgi:hypothetical protein